MAKTGFVIQVPIPNALGGSPGAIEEILVRSCQGIKTGHMLTLASALFH